MANTITVVGGLIVAIIGLVLWWLFRSDFVTVFKGCIGVTLFFGGVLALAIGISEMRASKEFEAAVPSTTEAKTEEQKPAEQTTETAASQATESTQSSETKEEGAS